LENNHFPLDKAGHLPIKGRTDPVQDQIAGPERLKCDPSLCAVHDFPPLANDWQQTNHIRKKWKRQPVAGQC
jgi:hypothetical protein